MWVGLVLLGTSLLETRIHAIAPTLVSDVRSGGEKWGIHDRGVQYNHCERETGERETVTLDCQRDLRRRERVEEVMECGVRKGQRYRGFSKMVFRFPGFRQEEKTPARRIILREARSPLSLLRNGYTARTARIF
eukprot:scaffold54828_cov30-Tisochrysis_lutea.AAC.22